MLRLESVDALLFWHLPVSVLDIISIMNKASVYFWGIITGATPGLELIPDRRSNQQLYVWWQVLAEAVYLDKESTNASSKDANMQDASYQVFLAEFLSPSLNSIKLLLF